ncbi:MAG: 2-hydroxyacid dehydrogenase, partial [Verrucomicrobiota bacterium]
MKVALFSAKRYDEEYFNACRDSNHEIIFHEAKLTPRSAALAQGADAVCIFVNDQAGRDTLQQLSEYGIKRIALRCAGFNNVD